MQNIHIDTTTHSCCNGGSAFRGLIFVIANRGFVAPRPRWRKVCIYQDGDVSAADRGGEVIQADGGMSYELPGDMPKLGLVPLGMDSPLAVLLSCVLSCCNIGRWSFHLRA